MNIKQNGFNITMCLSDYIAAAPPYSEISLHKSVAIPLSISTNLFDKNSIIVSNITEYQSIIGQLLFIVNSGRPDIEYPVSLLSRFLKDPREVQLRVIQRVFQ